MKESAEEWERGALLRQREVDLNRLVERVADFFKVDIEDLKSRSKVPSIAKARAVLCYVGVRKLGLTSASIAKELGISPSAVSKAIVRAPQFLDHGDIEEQRLECQ